MIARRCAVLQTGVRRPRSRGWLGPAHEMADDPAVAGHPGDRRRTDRRAVDELGLPDAIRQRVDIGHEMQRVAIGIGGPRGRVELAVAGANQVEQGIDPTLTGCCGHGFS